MPMLVQGAPYSKLSLEGVLLKTAFLQQWEQ